MSPSLSRVLLLLLLTFIAWHHHTVSGFNLAIVQGRHVKFVNLTTDGLEVIGLAKLANKLYAVCVSNDTIFEFIDHHPYNRFRTFTVPGMSPGDLVADPVTKKLYIIDWRPADEGGTRVWSVDPATGHYVYYVNATHWTGTLSLTPRRQVLGVSGDQWLNLYDSTSGLTRLQLPSSVVDPQHALQTSRGTFYVSQGWTTNQRHLVNEIDSTATRILNQFGSMTPGNGTYDLNWPRHLAYSRQRWFHREKLFVADYWNRRVLQLTGSLQFEEEVLSHDQSPSVGWPNRLLFDEKLGTLYVAMAETPLSFF